jgi:hypothetical protein
MSKHVGTVNKAVGYNDAQLGRNVLLFTVPLTALALTQTSQCRRSYGLGRSRGVLFWRLAGGTE